jgi:hypothetical protein
VEPNGPKVTDPNLARDIGNLEAKVDLLITTVKDQGVASENGRRRIYRSVNRLAERMIKVDSRLEVVEDKLESHGSAIQDFEKFRTDQVAQAQVAAIKMQTNRTWLKWLFAGFTGMGAIEGDHATGGRLLKWLGSLWTGK